MHDKAPDVFLASLQATDTKVLETPFRLFRIGKLLIHYIDFATYKSLPGAPVTFFAALSDEAERKELNLIHLWEDVWKRDTGLVKDRIKNILGKRERVHARQTEIIRLDRETADEFLNLHHLQKATSAYYKFGLMRKGELIAVATFSKGRVMHDGPVYYRSYELERFASKRGVTVTGGLGKLLEHFIRVRQPAHIMTYADRDWGPGNGYVKLGFTRQETSAPHSFLVNLKTMERIYLSKNKLSQMPGDDKDHLLIFNSGSNKYTLDRRAMALRG